MRSPQQIFMTTGLLRRAIMTGGWVPLSVRLVVDLDFSALQLILMGTAIELGVLLGEIPTGVIADTFSRKWSVVAGTLLLGVAQLASGLVELWPAYLVTQFVWGLGWTFLSGAEVAWITSEIGSAEETEPLLFRRGRLQFVAMIVGVFVFGGLGYFVSMQASVITAGAIGVLWSVALAAAMPENNFSRATSHRWKQALATLRAGAAHIRATRALRVLGVALVVAAIAAEAIDRLNTRRLEDLGLSDQASPVIVFGLVTIGTSAVAAIFLWRLESRFVGRNVVTGMAMLFAAVGVGVFAVAHTPVVVLAAVVLVAQGGLLDVTDPLIDVWVNALASHDERATVHSFVGQMRACGEIGGGVMLGTVAAVFTLPTALTASAVLFIAAAVITSTARRSWPQAGDELGS